jgi:hypothetical protein
VKTLLVAAIAVAVAAGVKAQGAGAGAPTSSNLRLVGHSDLNGKGNGGEGLDLVQYPDGRRILFYAHTAPPTCVTTVDVTDPAKPKVLAQLPTVAPHVRCNSLGVSATTTTAGRTGGAPIMVVAQNTDEPGQPNGGALIFDVADPARPRQLAYFDTSGGPSRGAHYVWFADGRYAYLSTGAPDFVPAVPPRGDDQFLMIVDVGNPRAPKEVGRWWMPGMRKGEPGAPLPRTKTADGVRMHSAFISPARPNRLYAGWIDGGIVILDISDKTRPRLIGQRSWYPTTPGYIGHSFLPILERGIAVVTQEANQPKCADWPKPIWTVDISDESQPKEITQFPYPAGLDEFCRAGRFGAHNIHMNRPTPTAAHLTQTVVAAFQNAGVRVYSIADPKKPQEIGSFIPAVDQSFSRPDDGPLINDVYVDEKGLIYAADRVGGGLYILAYTGSPGLR